MQDVAGTAGDKAQQGAKQASNKAQVTFYHADVCAPGQCPQECVLRLESDREHRLGRARTCRHTIMRAHGDGNQCVSPARLQCVEMCRVDVLTSRACPNVSASNSFSQVLAVEMKIKLHDLRSD